MARISWARNNRRRLWGRTGKSAYTSAERKPGSAWLSEPEASDLLRSSVDSLRMAAEAGVLERRVVGGCPWYRRRDVELILERIGQPR